MKELRQAFLVFIVLSLVTGIVYPLAISGLAHLLFAKKADGSLVSMKGKPVGSELIGQKFSGPQYFHGRPSTNDYDATTSGGSNFGPANEKYLRDIAARIAKVRTENRLSYMTPVPSDLVLASASGLDPDISLEGALLQVSRVARVRGLSEKEVADLVRTMVARPYGNGRPRVNVLKLNLALDAER